MKRSFRTLVLDAAGIEPWADALGALERDITYPIADGADRFHIDHGQRYHPFFSGLGTARFLLALKDDRPVGLVAGVFRDLQRMDGPPMPGVYVADFKLAREVRGQGYGTKMFAEGLVRLLFDREVPACRVAFGVAMQGATGDVTRSFRSRWHTGRLHQTLGDLRLWFASPAALRQLPDGPPPPTLPGLDLGAPIDRPAAIRTHGRKDMRLESTGDAWPLAHLPTAPTAWGAGLGATLRRGAEHLGDHEIACFALDDRLTEACSWLEAHGLTSGARARVYGRTHPLAGPAPWTAAHWVHMPTSEI